MNRLAFESHTAVGDACFDRAVMLLAASKALDVNISAASARAGDQGRGIANVAGAVCSAQSRSAPALVAQVRRVPRDLFRIA